MMSSRLIFFGTEDFSAPSLEALIATGSTPVLVVTKPDTPRGRGRQLSPPLVKTIAEQHGIPVIQPTRLTDSEAELKKYRPTAGVLVSYGKIIPQRILDLFEPVGIINLHSSLLPRYRGPAPIEAAIKNGDEQTGLSIMKLTAGMDEGPIFTQTSHPLSGQETRPELYSLLAYRGAEQLAAILPDILTGQILPKPQTDDDVTYTSLINKADGRLSPETATAQQLERQIRAQLGYPKSRLKVGPDEVIVTAASVVDEPQAGQLVIACHQNSWLQIDQLVAPSGRSMSGADFLRGRPAAN